MLNCWVIDTEGDAASVEGFHDLGAMRFPGAAKSSKSDTPVGRGSIIIVVATDAPLLPHQLKRLARRTTLGLALVGGRGHNDSGDLMIAFSVANPGAADPVRVAQLSMLPNESIDPLFIATIEATEKSIINAMLAAETMTGADRVRVHALPHHRLIENSQAPQPALVMTELRPCAAKALPFTQWQKIGSSDWRGVINSRWSALQAILCRCSPTF